MEIKSIYNIVFKIILKHFLGKFILNNILAKKPFIIFLNLNTNLVLQDEKINYIFLRKYFN